MDTAIQTPRDARLSINQGEAWLRRNQDRFHPTDRYILRILFEYAHTPAHAMALRDELTRRVISESSRTAAQPSLMQDRSPALPTQPAGATK